MHSSADPLKWGWALDAVCDHLMAITRGEITHLLANVPPGMMKSYLFNVFWPAYEWGPLGLTHLIYLGASHNISLSTRDNRRLRMLVSSDWYQKRWPIEIRKDQDSVTNFGNTQHGFSEVMAFKSMTGSRGHRIRIDDPHSINSAESDTERESIIMNFDEMLPSRKVNEKSAIAIIMQRIHASDVSGHILAEELEYTHLMLPMEFEPERRCYSVVAPTYSKARSPVLARYYTHTQEWIEEGEEGPEGVDLDDLPLQQVYCWDERENLGELLFPERFDKKEVERLQKSLKEYGTAGQLQQRPSPRGGGAFKKDAWQYLDTCPELVHIVRGWDLASVSAKTKAQKIKRARSAGIKMGLDRLGRVIIVHARKGHWTPGQVEQKMRATAEVDGITTVQDFPQDPGQSGKSQKRAFGVNLHGFVFHSTPETGSKEMRAEPLQAQQEAGNVFIVRGPWNKDFVEEAASFPTGPQKDQVDAASRAYARLLIMKSKGSNINSGSAPRIITVE